MVVDLTNILKIIQKKAANVDSNTSTQDLIDLLKAASRADGNLLTTINLLVNCQISELLLVHWFIKAI